MPYEIKKTVFLPQNIKRESRNTVSYFPANKKLKETSYLIPQQTKSNQKRSS